MATSRDDIQDATGQRSNLPGGGGFTRGFGIGVAYQVTANTKNSIAGNPIDAEKGWAPGAIFINPKTAVLGNFVWINVGTFASSSWVALI